MIFPHIYTVARFGALALTTLSLTFGAAAQDEGDDDKNNFIVLGAASLPEFEGASSHQWVPLGVADLNFRGMNLEIRGLQGTLDILGRGGSLKLGPAFSLSTPREDVIPVLPAFGEVDFAIEVGGFIGFETPFGGADEGTLSGQVSVRQDVTGAHGGLLITPEIEYFFALHRMFRVGFSANATWASGDYMESYFSVSPGQREQSGLELFDAGTGIKDIGVEAFSIFSFSEQWGIFTRVSCNRLLGDAADSPIVQTYGDRNQMFYGAGVFFRF